MSEETIKISIELSRQDLAYFRERLKHTRKSRSKADETIVIQAAVSLLEEALATDSPEFVTSRLRKLERLIDMVSDAEWRLEGRDRARVLDALAYFADPEDLIPDRVPGIGYLDDAIMVELVVRELKHELRAYDDFIQFRAHPQAVDEKKLEARRSALQQRMTRRRRSDIERLRNRRVKKSPLGLW